VPQVVQPDHRRRILAEVPAAAGLGVGERPGEMLRMQQAASSSDAAAVLAWPADSIGEEANL
jgi:hypothetical protein